MTGLAPHVDHAPSLSGPLGVFRKKAKAKADAIGLPSKKLEPFTYYANSKLTKEVFADKTIKAPSAPTVFHNGCLVKKEDGIVSLDEGASQYATILQRRIGKAIERETNPFSLLNVAHFEGGGFIYVPPGEERSIHIALHCDTAVSFTRIHAIVGRGGSLKVKMLSPSLHEEAFAHLYIDVALEENAHATLYSASNIPHAGVYQESLRITQKRDAKSRYFMESSGGKATRYDTEVYLEGENSETSLEGVHALYGKAEAHTHILVRHVAPHCTSNQKIKYGLFDASRSSFDGEIYVEKEAQQTMAYQLNNNLILGESATAYSKPNLEIFADDVKASHGCTIGQLSDEELLYLETRGLDKEKARSMLTKAFFQEMFDARPVI